MIYSGDLVKINGNTIPKIKTYKVGRHKLWKNSNRNMNGDTRGTLIGLFPKIQLQIGECTQEEISALTVLFDLDFFDVTWFDVRIQGTTTARYYAGDYDTGLLDKQKGKYEPFDVSLIPVSKRRY